MAALIISIEVETEIPQPAPWSGCTQNVKGLSLAQVSSPAAGWVLCKPADSQKGKQWKHKFLGGGDSKG